jgi:two-component system chemotaxis response regulator CheY
LLADLQAKVDAHFTVEDSVVYPRLSGHPDLSEEARAALAETASLRIILDAFFRRFTIPGAIQKDSTEMGREIRALLGALKKRSENEERWLFPLLSEADEGGTEGKGRIALVVDDSGAVRAMVGQFLKELGYEVVQAEDGLAAWEWLESHGPVDVALFDWNMPRMTGYELVQKVRGAEVYSGMPIMMVTSEAQLESVMQALEAGANEYIMKPFDKAGIAEKLVVLGLG